MLKNMDITGFFDYLDMHLNESRNFVVENLTYSDMMSEENAVPCRSTRGRFAFCKDGLKAGKFGYGDGTKWVWVGDVAALNAGIYKDRPARAKSTENISNLFGPQTVDGIALVDGEFVLLNDQTNQAQNGVWIVKTGAWVRRDDCDTWYDLVSAMVVISEGTTYADTQWMCTIDEGLETNLNSSPVTWIQIPLINDIVARYGLKRTGNLLDVNPDKKDFTTKINYNGTYNDVVVNIDPEGAIGTVDTETGLADEKGIRVRPDNVTIKINANNDLETTTKFKVYRKLMNDESIRLYSPNVDNVSYYEDFIIGDKEIIIPHNMGVYPYSIQFRTVESGSEKGCPIYPHIINVTSTTVVCRFSINNVQHNTGVANYNRMAGYKVEVFMIGGE